MVDEGAYEFAETENFLKIGEDLLGKLNIRVLRVRSVNCAEAAR